MLLRTPRPKGFFKMTQYSAEPLPFTVVRFKPARILRKRNNGEVQEVKDPQSSPVIPA